MSEPLMQIPTLILFTKSTSSNQKILPTKREIGKQGMDVEGLPSPPLGLTSSYSKTIIINVIYWKRLHLYSCIHRQPSASSDLDEALHLGGGWHNLLGIHRIHNKSLSSFKNSTNSIWIPHSLLLQNIQKLNFNCHFSPFSFITKYIEIEF